MNIAMEYPALTGGVVTQAHADYCRDHGHATHTSNGVVSPWCPRCGANTPAPEAVTIVRAEDVKPGATLTGYSGGDPVTGVQAVAPSAAPGYTLITWITASGSTFDEDVQNSRPVYVITAPTGVTAPALDIHPRALDLAAMAAPGAVRVDLDPATAPAAIYATSRAARATVTAYFQGGPGRGECVDAVIVTVTGGDSHPARNFAASDAITALQALVSGPITAGEYQTMVDPENDTTLFIYGTWND